jgi:hypothetical protein
VHSTRGTSAKEAICGPAMRSYHPPSLRAHRGRSEVALRRDMIIGPSLSVMALLGEIGRSCGELVLPLIIELSVSVLTHRRPLS